MSARDFEEWTSDEVAEWPGASVRFEARSKHNAAIVSFGDAERFVTYPSTPSDNGRAIYNHVSDVRRTLGELGAVRNERRKSEREASERNPGAKMRQMPGEMADARPDPWEALQKLAGPLGPTYHTGLIQGSEEWHAARCGLLTASEMKLILTPTLKLASNDKERAHLYELLAQRITGYVEPHYISDDMLRGRDDEIDARSIYAKTYSPVEEAGFITNDRWGFTIGYSPDGLVGEDGLIECKSRRQKYQVQTIVEHVGADTIMSDYMIQVQTGLMVAERKWCDLVSYCGGLPMATVRVLPDPVIQDAIVSVASAFEARLCEKMAEFHATVASRARLVPTERKIEQEMFV